jgi:hypothetical protein
VLFNSIQFAEFLGWVALPFKREFKHRNFRPGTKADREAGDSNAAVHVELRASFFVPAPDQWVDETLS